jgi:uncharacterized membrane protein YcaP (DUF421 family)
MHNGIFGIDVQGLLVPGISILEKIIRPILVYLLLVIGLRLAGKREMAQLNTFDMVVLLTLSNTVQNAIIGNDNSLSGGIIGAATLLIINYLMVRLIFTNKRFENIIEGNPDLLIQNGRIKTERLKKELITQTELEEAAHKQGISSLSEVDKAVLDTDGTISFFTKESSSEIIRHREILKKLNTLSHDINEIKKTLLIR